MQEGQKKNGAEEDLENYYEGENLWIDTSTSKNRLSTQKTAIFSLGIFA